jgi:hypothetical protein
MKKREVRPRARVRQPKAHWVLLLLSLVVLLALLTLNGYVGGILGGTEHPHQPVQDPAHPVPQSVTEGRAHDQARRRGAAKPCRA